MQVPDMEWSYHFSDVPEFTMDWGWADEEPRVPHPTKAEFNACPDRFTCFVCLQQKGKKKHFGGLVEEQKVCRECYPFVDEQDVGCLVKFDERHGFAIQ